MQDMKASLIQYYEASCSENKVDKTETNSLARKLDGFYSCLQCVFTNKQKGNVYKHVQSVHE